MAKPKLNLAGFTGIAKAAAGLVTPADAEVDVMIIDVERQVRTDLGDLSDLVTSIRDIGVIEPIILLEKDDGRYRLIAGERRFKASEIAGLVKIPAVIKRNLNDMQIRQIQVTENNDRENLSPFDEAMGVVEDVETFGAEEARRIWNRSDGWVSKRVAVKKYAPPVLALLKSKRCGDLEVLHSLNQLHGLDKGEFDQMEKRLVNGAVLSRDEARSKVASVKEWVKGKRVLETRRKEAEKQDKSDRPQAELEDQIHPPAEASLDEQGGDAGADAARDERMAGKSTARVGQAAADKTRARLESNLSVLRRSLFSGGVEQKATLSDIRSTMGDLDYSHTESDWVLWSGFLSAVLPVIEAMGDDKGASFLRKLQTELKGQSAVELWKALHGESAEIDVPVKPDQWVL